MEEHPTADRNVPGSTPGAPFHIRRLSIWLILLCRDWFEFWAFQHEVRRNEHFTRRAVASLPVCHWHSSPIVLRVAPIFVTFNSWRSFVSFPIELLRVQCLIVKTQETRTFCLNRNGFLIRFHQFLLSLRRSFCFNFCFFWQQRFQNLNFLSRKAPGSIPLLLFRLTCCVTEVKKSTKDRKRKSDGRSSERKKESSLETG